MSPSNEDYLSQWNMLLVNQLEDPERAALLQFMAESINTAVADRSSVRIDVTDALSAILDGTRYDDQTWRAVDTSLTVCLDEWAPRLIGWLVLNPDYPSRLAEIRSRLSPAALALIQGLLARYGSDLEAAFYMSGGFIDEWRTIWRGLRVDPSTNQYRITLRIQKYTGEDMVIESRPDTMLTLATQVLASLNAVPADSAFTDDTEQFLSEARTLVQALTPAPAAPPAQVAPVSPTPAADGSGGSESQQAGSISP